VRPGEQADAGGDRSIGGRPTPAGPPSGGSSPSGIGALGDIQLLSAMLGNDRSDVASYVRVLTGALGDALPAGVVEVDRQRSLGDRMAGRPGTPVGLIIRGADRELELTQRPHGSVEAQVRKVVGGVVISRRQVPIDEWVRQFAEVLMEQTAQNAAARQALAALLGM